MASTMNICRMSLRRALAFSATARQATAAPRRTAFVPFSSSSSFSTSAAVSSSATAPAEAPSQDAAAAADATSATTALSSCPEGTVLTGLNYVKGRTDPVALRDDEYPPWLWNCLDVIKKAATAEDAEAGDEFSKSKKQRRLALRRQRDLEAQVRATGDVEALAPKIPLQHQSLNLPSEAGDLEGTLEAAARRREHRVALRKERRAKIKENNYLRSM